METKTLRTYKFYDSKGRRLAIFAKPDNGYLDVFILACSKKDMFSRKFANNVYNSYNRATLNTEIVHPVLKQTPIVNGDLGRSFIAYCKQNFYYKTQTRELVTIDVLVAPNVTQLK